MMTVVKVTRVMRQTGTVNVGMHLANIFVLVKLERMGRIVKKVSVFYDKQHVKAWSGIHPFFGRLCSLGWP